MASVSVFHQPLFSVQSCDGPFRSSYVTLPSCNGPQRGSEVNPGWSQRRACSLRTTLPSAGTLRVAFVRAVRVLADDKGNDYRGCVSEHLHSDETVMNYSNDEFVYTLRPVEAEDIEAVESMLSGRTSKFYPGNEGRVNIRLLLALGFGHKEVATVFNGYSSICTVELIPKLKQFQRHGLSIENIIGAACTSPRIFTVDEQQITEVCHYLSETLQVRNLGKVLEKCPEILGMGLSMIQAKLEHLAEVGVENFGTVIERQPRFLTYSLDTLPVKLNGLKDVLGADNVGLAVSRYPRLIGMKKKTLQETYQGLVQLFGEQNVLFMFQKQPGILQLSWANVREKLDFVEKEMGRDIRDVVDAPHVLFASLERRMRPRFNAVRARGDKDKYSLNTMFMACEAQFYGMTHDPADSNLYQQQHTPRLVTCSAAEP
eukprot:jgi/Mesen1/958/ME000012S00506